MSGDIVDELEWRGLVAQATDMDALRERLAAGPITVYAGFDPTAPSLHHGHLVQLVLLRHLQRAGHHVIALVGGATGLIGDPRPTTERALNTRETVKEWTERLGRQISSFLDFGGENPARMANNLDWTADLTAIDFLRDIGKHYRLGTMLAKDIVARRLASDEGISFTEFSYQILQGMDFLELNRRYGCELQTGGSDQWGNLLSGVELVRKADQKRVFAMTTPLITKSDGTKFGKTSGGAVWLDPSMMSPYAFYQFWFNTADQDVIGWLKTFTFRSRDEIAELEKAMVDSPFARAAQRALAHDVTALVHGEEATNQAILAAQALFGRGDIAELDESTLLAAVAELPHASVRVPTPLVDALVAVGIVKGKNEARRALSEGGIYINNVKVEGGPDAVLDSAQFLHGKVALVRRGKKSLAALHRDDSPAT
ncbi:tyrosine--tRNA ligase [Rarobacter incanus]|uniref:tyrosine--tRNA ligase n=1 Tax=Rarobacter incanus TaxID=153494 RepID=UPI002482EFFE|nr:tyrosine--tRNA ligase [Rarobacter incanus]